MLDNNIWTYLNLFCKKNGVSPDPPSLSLRLRTRPLEPLRRALAWWLQHPPHPWSRKVSTTCPWCPAKRCDSTVHSPDWIPWSEVHKSWEGHTFQTQYGTVYFTWREDNNDERHYGKKQNAEMWNVGRNIVTSSDLHFFRPKKPGELRSMYATLLIFSNHNCLQDTQWSTLGWIGSKIAVASIPAASVMSLAPPGWTLANLVKS